LTQKRGAALDFSVKMASYLGTPKCSERHL
jgi:hypothetical protein